MSFLLDTDICSAHLKDMRRLDAKFLQYGGRLHISVVTLGELLTWALRLKAPPTRLKAIEKLLSDVVVLEVTEPTVHWFGKLRASSLDSGKTIPEMDALIAATALEHGLTVVTHNVRDFSNVVGLNIEDWLAP